MAKAREDRLGELAVGALDAFGKAVGMGGLAGAVLTDHKGWDPVVPDDLHLAKLPPVADDGTAECWQCRARLPFAQLDIAGQAYSCRPCALRTSQVAAAQQAASIDVDNVKVGRGRWWILPLCFAGAIGICVALYLV